MPFPLQCEDVDASDADSEGEAALQVAAIVVLTRCRFCLDRIFPGEPRFQRT